jgi:hypothetical protein
VTDEVRGGFLHRWSRRKIQSRQGQRLEDEPLSDESVAGEVSDDAATARVDGTRGAPSTGSAAVRVGGAEAMSPAGAVSDAGAIDAAAPGQVAPPSDDPSAQSKPAPLTLDDVQALSSDSDFAPFVSQQVDPRVRNAALKKLFADPHYNVMDGLDIYIDDYSQLEPLPAPMLRRMASAHALKMFDALTEDGDAVSQDQAQTEGPDEAANSQRPDDDGPAGELAPPQDTALPGEDISQVRPARSVG